MKNVVAALRLYLTTIFSGVPVTVGKDQLTTVNSTVTPWRDRWPLGKTGIGVNCPSKSVYNLREKKPEQATERRKEKYTRGRTGVGEDDRPTGQQVMNTPDQPTTSQDTDWSRTCSCRKVCKNEVGLKIQRTKMRCAPILNLMQRARQLSETEEELDHDEHQSIKSPQASDEEEVNIDNTEPANEQVAEESTERRKKVMWSASTERAKWKAFEEELEQVMENENERQSRVQAAYHVCVDLHIWKGTIWNNNRESRTTQG